ncbi:RusA family crossover junction endodeoxyribonuclease [Nonomuraea sp. NPDC051191]|uniref:RusA family crossover junction endodeoxyribonuclease n=1 Tax=Nonomuraea sp. NPDC051191 TaxID=3364372 RepID=UPI0037BC19E4
MTPPLITIMVYGTPGSQGSKRPVGKNRMIEQNATVKPWRQDVRQAAMDEIDRRAAADEPFARLDGPIIAEMVFTMGDKPSGRPTWWPSGVRWSKALWWHPASAPDLSKLLRSTEDALTQAGVWKDDARVVRYRELAKVYVGQVDEPDALRVPGAVIRLWSGLDVAA